MAKAYFKCSQCGDSVVVIGQNRSAADRLAQYRQDQKSLCHDCWDKQRAEQRAADSQAAAESAAQTGLPALTGSEKQIAWAETIRRENLSRLTALADGLEGDHAALVAEATDLIRAQDRAAWWIDTRGEYWWQDRSAFAAWLIGGSKFFDLPVSEQMARARAYMGGLRPAEPPAPPAVVAEARAEATVIPAARVTATPAEFRQVDGGIHIIFPEKRDDFRAIVKACGYRWSDDHWRCAGPTAGDPAERLVEAAHRLLAGGFPVIVQDADLRRRAVAGEFEPRHTRWIERCNAATHLRGWFLLSWSYEEDYYAPSRQIPGSVWEKPYVAVPPEQFEELLDFADRYDFRLSPGAQEAVKQARANRAAALITDIQPKPRAKPKKITRADLATPAPMAAPAAGIDPTLTDE